MAKRKSFLLRIDPRCTSALEQWAADELRSVNAQIEFLLRQALIKAGRLKVQEQGDTKKKGWTAKNRASPKDPRNDETPGRRFRGRPGVSVSIIASKSPSAT